MRRVHNYIPEIKYNQYIAMYASEVKVINEHGNFVGEMDIKTALDIAYSKNLDLVQISQEKIPVCKICDYGKYKYELSKKNKEKNINNKPTQIKMIKLSLNIGSNDLKTKIKKAEDFLNELHKVQFSLRLKGRENIKPDVAIEFMKKICSNFQDNWQIEKPPTQINKEITMVIGRRLVQKKTNEKDTNNEEELKNNSTEQQKTNETES